MRLFIGRSEPFGWTINKFLELYEKLNNHTNKLKFEKKRDILKHLTR